ncbi:MAG: hypothetical protein A3K03_09230 [Bdellovibrionales bacterium RIFOXYD1_FULL_44_7]|nr:MAG: hypothetical protein A3K03_09230 [Bdellovibrionales bacterium RIFOXYD1_FULL_44_7]
MDISNRNEPGGEELISAVVSATGLPESEVKGELDKILQSSGHDPANLTIDQLRSAMIAYLEAVHESLWQEENEQTPTS